LHLYFGGNASTLESKKILNPAAEEADRLGHGHIGTEHIPLGLLRVEGSPGKLSISPFRLKISYFFLLDSRFQYEDIGLNSCKA